MRKKKSRRRLSKLKKTAKVLKILIPMPPPGFSFKSKKDYNRTDNRKIIKGELSD